MKIELSKEQYRTLLELVFLGNWMINSIKEEIDHETQKYDELESHMFLLAKDFGFGEWSDGEFEFTQAGDVYPGAEFEEKSAVFNFIDKYDDYTFWEELSHKLARRDLIRQYGVEGLSNMRFEERIKKEDELIGKYDRIFFEIGLEVLKVKEVDDPSQA